MIVLTPPTANFERHLRTGEGRLQRGFVKPKVTRLNKGLELVGS